MRNRILEISLQPARLRVEHRQLVIQPPEGTSHSVPLEDIAVLIVAHPQVSYTQAVLSDLIGNGGTFVTCQQFPVWSILWEIVGILNFCFVKAAVMMPA